MATYRVGEQHGRIAVYDEFGRNVELFPAGTSEEEVAARITSKDRSGYYVAGDQLITQRTFDPESQQWGETRWPRSDA